LSKAEDDFEAFLKGSELHNFVREWKFHPVRRWRFDFADPTILLAIEIDGGTWVQGRHNTGAGYAKDAEKYNEAIRLGWAVLRFTPQMVRKDPEGTRDLIRECVSNTSFKVSK